MNQKQYAPKENITIGNGLGQHKFLTHRSYSESVLRTLMITAGQIHAYFTTNKKSVQR